jgi:ATP-dependent RNA helicase RhlE
MSFSQLNIISPILQALEQEGYTNPTPIQTQTIPLALNRQDILGVAQTGTGKTAAFAIPILQLLSESGSKKFDGNKKAIRALILTPTRELAIQIGESFETYGRNTKLKSKVIFGGVKAFSQVNSLKSGVDILIATPGRLMDLMGQGHVNLKQLDFFVLDEADRMLDMGFVREVKKIITFLPKQRQSLFFSATMPPAIVDLANSILIKPARVEVTPVSSTVNIINQSVYFVDKGNKKHLLQEILQNQTIERVLVFSRTKHGADKVVKYLVAAGIKSQAIHGNKSQNNRQKALNSFKEKTTRVLVATDIAARGIDIDELTHVINYELPNIPESYVHRIGRTGRAGADGTAIAFCDIDEKEFLRDIEKLIGKKIPVVENHIYPLQNTKLSKPEVIEKRGMPAPSRGNEKRNFEKNGNQKGKKYFLKKT